MNTKDSMIQPAARAPISPLKRLLVALDRSKLAEAALPYAVTLSKRFGARIQLVHVLHCAAAHAGTSPHDALAWQIARTEAEDYLEQVALGLRKEGRDVETAVLQGHPAEQLLCFAEAEGTDLLVISSHGNSGPGEWRLGSTTEKVISLAPSSVLVVPVADPDMRPPGEIDLARVLVMLDGSPRAEVVLPLLERLVRETEIGLVLMHVVKPVELMEVVPATAEDRRLAERLDSRNEEVARRYVTQMKDRLQREGCTVTVIIERGDPRQVVHEVIARESIDLVAFTAHGVTGDDTSACGSTAAHLLRYGQRPVLMIQDLPQRAAMLSKAVRHQRQIEPRRGQDASART